MFTEKDLQQFAEKNISLTEIERQIDNFRKGFPFVNLVAAATPGHGIRVLNEAETAASTAVFSSRANSYSVTKMVPASGAASRMFKDLFTYMTSESDIMNEEVKQFINGIEDFAFYPALKASLAEDDYLLEELLAEGEYKTVIRYLLTDSGLGYAELPKGLLFFHKYDKGPRTPLEEHMVEALEYSIDGNRTAHLHFTVSPEHKKKFLERTQAVGKSYVRDTNASFDISWSEQKPSTDTIAVGLDNEPFRENDGTILFRPGGHGALIENLNDLSEDIVFIKNIDNVVPDRLKAPTYLYKKAIGGMLIDLMERSFSILNKIDENSMNAGELQEAVGFAKEELNISFDQDMGSLPFEQQKSLLAGKLDRPIRVCGMVKNEGEPGGGPFWVETQDGKSLQIVESAQINLYDERQKSIMGGSTHFNPVDLVCSLKNFRGEKFDLREFVDPQTGFISVKSKDGKELKAQELPGLWNGAMAKWITIFVEVPIETFNPVKTVNDLLRRQHQ